MAELKITPIVPDDDDEKPRPRRGSHPGQNKKSDDSGRKPTIKATNGEHLDEAEEEEEFDPKAVEEEVKKRYGIDRVKVTKLSRSRSGAGSHKTGSTRK